MPSHDSLSELVTSYLAGPKEMDLAGVDVVPVMIHVAKLRGDQLMDFIRSLGAEEVIKKKRSNHRDQTDISLLVGLRNWLVERRLSRTQITDAGAA